MERRFHNPYKHWVSGLLMEIAVLSGFVAVLIVIALAAAWAVG